jgi:bifunctional N-acetylglucosamine-1-phosphate-uridyltransferase/glucosamine-1-phosphate-acetyltransferase GlmU-like protein
LGSGNAVHCSLNQLNDTGMNLVVNGDNPMLTHETLNSVIVNFMKYKFELQITAINAKNPTGCGRVIIGDGVFRKIVEEKDCDKEQKEINLINTGIYLALNSIWRKYVPFIKNNNVQNEYYITDIAEIYHINTNQNCGLFVLDSNKELEIININTKEQLDELNKILTS